MRCFPTTLNDRFGRSTLQRWPFIPTTWWGPYLLVGFSRFFWVLLGSSWFLWTLLDLDTLRRWEKRKETRQESPFYFIAFHCVLQFSFAFLPISFGRICFYEFSGYSGFQVSTIDTPNCLYWIRVKNFSTVRVIRVAFRVDSFIFFYSWFCFV